MQLLRAYHHRMDGRPRVPLPANQVIVYTSTGKLVWMDYSEIDMDSLIKSREWVRNAIGSKL